MQNVSTDMELINRLQKGDIDAFDSSFKKYAGKIYAFGMKYLRSKEDAEGLVQNIFLKIWEKRRSLKDHSSLKSYLFTIAYHDICNIYRKRKNHRHYIDSIAQNASFTSSTKHNAIEFKLLLDQINTLITKLPEKQRKVFLKSRNDGLTSKEIAKEMNLSYKTVDNYISLTIKFLKSKLSTEILLLIGLVCQF